MNNVLHLAQPAWNTYDFYMATQLHNKMIQLLEDHLNQLQEALPNVSVAAFSQLFADSVLLFNLSDREVAERFSASCSTANRWKHGKSAPSPGQRKLILSDLKAMTSKRIKGVRKQQAELPKYRSDGTGSQPSAPMAMAAKSG